MVSHALPVLELMARRNQRVVCLGGTLNAQTQSFTGADTTAVIRRAHIDFFFLSATAVDARGVIVDTDAEWAVRRALVDATVSVILLADHDKFRSVKSPLLCELHELAAVVTDRAPPDVTARALNAANIPIYIGLAAQDAVER